MMLTMLTFVQMVQAEILINEFLYNPDGTDGPLEWIEICNNGEDPVDISGWQIESAGTSWSESWTFPSGTVVDAGVHYAFGPGALGGDAFSPNLPNGGSPVDGIRLLQGNGTVVDTVLYGVDNSNGFLDDLGNSTGPFAPNAGSGNTLARSSDCVEVNNDGSDFVETSTLTMGSANITPQSTACENTITSGIVINEVLYNPGGSDSGHEWVEIFNTTENEIDLSGWTLQAGTSSFGDKVTLASGTMIPPYGYLLIGEELVIEDLGQNPDVITSLSLGNGSSSIDGLRLLDCNDVVLDTVLYGDPSSIGDWTDDNGANPMSFAPEVGDGESIARVPNGLDSNQSGHDFVMLTFPTPWSANDAEATCDGATAIKINEFLPNPHVVLSDGTEISDDEGREWVELYNNSVNDIDLGGWKLQWGGTSSYSGGEFTIPFGTTISGNGFIVLGGEYVEEANVTIPLDNDLDMTLASSNADAVRLLHCGPGVADTVIYGPSSNGVANNSDELLDDTENIAVSVAPKPQEGLSIARYADGVDSNQSGWDFTVAAQNTPGAPNPEIICGEGNFQIKINEILPNPDGSDSGQEWVELYNAGTETVRLDAWSIEVGSSSFSVKATIPGETSLAPGAFYLIGEKDVPAEIADLSLESTLSLGNASTGVDGIRLVNCLGGVEDTLLYGKADAQASVDEELFDDQGLTTFAVFSDSGKTIGRYPDGVDSDDNSVDFQSNLNPTPRLSNSGSDDTGTDTDTNTTDPKTGCNRQPEAPNPNQTPSKCSYVDGLSSMMWFSVLVVLLRRKE